MGGGGSIAGMITSLKNNNRRKVRIPFSKNKIYKIKKETLDDYDFPDSTPEQLKIIRERLIAYNRQVAIKSSVITITIVILIVYLVTLVRI